MQKIIILSFLILLLGCQKEELASSFPLIQTGEVTDISAKGAKFHALFISEGSGEITEWGFVFSSEVMPTLANSEHISIQETPQTGPVSYYVPTMLIEHKTYQVRAYVKSKKHVTYGSPVSFLSLGSGGPDLLDFYPKVANKSDTITIIGRNFSVQKEFNQVAFGEKYGSEVIYATTDTIKVIVPDYIEEESSELSVSLVGNKATFSEQFRLYAPKINKIYKEEVNTWDILCISGQGFTTTGQLFFQPVVLFGNIKAPILYLSTDSIAIKVPKIFQPTSETGNEFDIKVTNHNQLISQEFTKVTLLAPEITDFYPKEGNLLDTLTILGRNFTLLKNPAFSTEFQIFGSSGSVIFKSPDSLRVVISTKPNLGIEDRHRITIKNHNNLSSQQEEYFSLLRPEITSISPGRVNVGDTVIISGKHLASNYSQAYNPSVLIDGTYISLLEISPTKLKVSIKSFLPPGKQTIQIINHNNQIVTIKDAFIINQP